MKYTTNYCIFLRSFFHVKFPAENAGNGISEPLNLKMFWGSMPADPPSLELLRRSNFSSRANTFKISRYAPASHQMNSKSKVKFCNVLRPYLGIETISSILVVQMARMEYNRFENLKKIWAFIKGTKKYYVRCSRRNLFNSLFITLREHFVTKYIINQKQQYSCEGGKTTKMCWWWRWW